MTHRYRSANIINMNKMRLDRYLAECACGTRSEVRKLIKNGRVTVNGKATSDPSLKVTFPDDAVCLDNQQLVYEEFRYFMLNKPQGCVSATRDGISSTVLDMLEGENTGGLFPVGRLDKDTEGLLLITNDGQLGHNMLSPRKHVEKTYIAAVSHRLSSEQLNQFATGLDIGDEKITLPAKIKEIIIGEESQSYRITSEIITGEEPQSYRIENEDSNEKEIYEDCEAQYRYAAARCDKPAAVYSVTICEGRYHQIKRMFQTLGSEVLFLRRISMGPLRLDPALGPGEYRRLTATEIESLRK